ncbi:hypothetical protein B9Z19DRAFT_898149, partial [Tuber borchii]
MRDRFISTYRKNKLHNSTRKDRRIIAEGNATVHGGDIISDVSLYFSQATSPQRRNDPAVFKKLYGIHPSMVAQIKYEKIIDLLNSHAGVVASDFKTTSKRFSGEFAKFVMALKEAGYPGGYLDVSDSKVAIAHEKFM